MQQQQLPMDDVKQAALGVRGKPVAAGVHKGGVRDQMSVLLLMSWLLPGTRGGFTFTSQNQVKYISRFMCYLSQVSLATQRSRVDTCTYLYICVCVSVRVCVCLYVCVRV